MDGWVKIHRKIIENHLWLCEKFTRSQAWIDLLLLANHKDGFFYMRGVKVDIKRSQIGWSEKKLSNRWSWSRTKVRKFLKDLEKEHQIKIIKSNVTQIVTIINYDMYQSEVPQKDTRSTPEVHQKDTNKKEKKEKNDKNIIPPTLKMIENYISEKEYNIDSGKFFNFYEAKGWLVGKNKMKDWQASIRTWLPQKEKLNNKILGVNQFIDWN